MQRLRHRTRDRILPLIGRRASRPASGDPHTVLVVQPDHLGDILLAQPAVRWLRATLPDHRLIAVVGPWSESITRMAWPVDEIVPVAFPGFTRDRKQSPAAPYRQLMVEARRLREYRAASAVVLRPDAWWAAWLAWLSTSDSVTTGDDPRSAAFATRSVPIPAAGHAAVRALAIAAGIRPGLEAQGERPSTLGLPPSAEAEQSARALLKQHGVDGAYVVVHPGSGAPVKLWPVHRWRSVLRRSEQSPVIVTGSADEASVCNEIARGLDHVTSLAGQTPIEILAEILRGARLVIGTDSGPMHLAVAAGVPTVHLFGPSDPKRYGPWGPGDRHIIVRSEWTCPACGNLDPERPGGCGCMLAITEEMVRDAVDRLEDTDGA